MQAQVTHPETEQRLQAARALSPATFNTTETGSYQIRCGCGTQSGHVGRTKQEASALAQVKAGFRVLGERLWCRKCSRDEKRRKQYGGK